MLGEILPFAATWIDHESNVLSDIDGKSQDPYDFTLMWDINLKTKYEQTRQSNKNLGTDQIGGCQKERRLGGGKRVKGIKYMVAEGKLTLSVEHTMQHSDMDCRIVHWKPIQCYEAVSLHYI